MGKRCTAPGCREIYKKGNKTKFHSFPVSNSSLRNKWEDALGREGWKPGIYSVICSKHFTEDCYKPGLLYKSLKEDAVPSIFCFTKRSVSPPQVTVTQLECMEADHSNLPLAASTKELASTVTVTQLECMEADHWNLPLAASTKELASTVTVTQLECMEADHLNLPLAASTKELASTVTVTHLECMEADHSNLPLAASTKELASTVTVTQSECMEADHSNLSLAGSTKELASTKASQLGCMMEVDDQTLSAPTTEPSSAATLSVPAPTNHPILLTPLKPVVLNKSIQTEKYISPTKQKLQKKVKRLQDKLRRRERKIEHFSDLIKELKSKVTMSTDLEAVLTHHFSGYPLELLLNHYKNTKVKNNYKRYSDLMKKFALTLHFYSPQAYRFLRKHFMLPHPQRLKSWISSVSCEPGYIEEVFKFLEENRNNKNLSHLKECSLIIDGMSIRKQLLWDGKNQKYTGYIDLGGVAALEDDDLASEALVFQIVSYTKKFKCPVAYFLVNGISYQVLAQMIHTCIAKLYEVGINIRSVTCDGAKSNIQALNSLGCNLGSTPIVSSFKHPVQENLDVHVILDPCHMLKLARNTLAYKQTILSDDGNVRFSYIVKLQKLQDEEQLSFSNSLSEQHVKFKNKKMKVSLAAQTLSSSVADAIAFLDYSGHPDFQNSHATVMFIRKIDKLFDILNSKNIYSKGFKQPLTIENIYYCQTFFEEMERYFLSLKIDNIPGIAHPRKTFILGFLACMKSVFNLASELLFREQDPLKYFLTYKLSQDHIEQFFACIRAKGGWNNNPNTQQLKCALKSLLLKNNIGVGTNSNVEPDTTCLIPIAKFRTDKRKTLNVNDEIEEDTNIHYFEALDNETLSDVQKNILYYISGFIVRKIKLSLNCHECLELLLLKPVNENSIKHDHTYCKCLMNDHTSLTKKSTRGGLIFASEGVFKIVEYCEKAFRKATLSGGINKFLINSIIRHFSNNSKIFGRKHSINVAFEMEDLHETTLIKDIVNMFISVRAKAYGKRFTANAQGSSCGLRQKLTKVITFLNV